MNALRSLSPFIRSLVPPLALPGALLVAPGVDARAPAVQSGLDTALLGKALG